MGRKRRKTHPRCERCRKDVYVTEEAAIHVALRCARLRGYGLRYYPCPDGSGWHLTRKAHYDWWK